MPPERQRKLVNIDNDVLRAVADYSRETGAHLDDIHNEALRDYLKKKGQPVTLHEALKQSTKMIPANDRPQRPARKRRR